MAREALKQSLLDQIPDPPIYVVDLIDRYLFLWETSRKLEENIEEHGVMLQYQNGANQWGFKKNDSIAELTKVNTQMLSIIRQLGIKAPEKVADDGAPNLDLI